ncbi:MULTISPECIES: M23 family metallopeptidase [Pontibacillus]|uniref:M23 family metallopeptidase n=1 Tax=Pontibacillus chungwhensis TaxID=265426 RepID=A0ABY8UZW2_9BACI|nr:MULTISPECIES: M23 family metallopeptidase [Pontibacillus]MCD5324926.1 M23 family metallopeptidase [Pontibacillus sp. HN14]WIF98885.1 M23 family metallopeptidase [Pontibacillus chungwhensis]
MSKLYLKQKILILVMIGVFMISGLAGVGVIIHAKAQPTKETSQHETRSESLQLNDILMAKKSEVVQFLLERKATEREASYFENETIAKETMNKKWALIPNVASRGDMILVRSESEGTLEWQGRTYTLKPFGSGFYTYLPIPMSVKPGNYPIGNRTLTIQKKTFETQHITVSEENENIRNNTEQIMKDQQKIDKARSQSEEEFLFPPNSSFIQPVEGQVTTPFGYTRYVNGEFSGSHTAIDWGAPAGTPVKATNDGIVALADSLHLTGNSVYIDHGMDLFSQYIHMSKLNVKAGDHVKKGDIIGYVGSTGFSTGPHMHFTFWVHNVPSNPNQYLGTSPFHLDQAQ